MATPAASFVQMSAYCRNLAVEFENLSAMPAVHDAQSIAQELRAMNQDLRDIKEVLKKLTSQMDNVRSDVKVFSTENQARDGNALIRLENARANTPGSRLQPLFSHMNGAPIENFPRTLGEVSELNEQQVNIFLCALGLTTDGSLEERLRRFLFACGVSHKLL